MADNFSKIQKEVDKWANQFEKPYFSHLSMLACMTEELGEVSRVINVLYGDKNAKDGENIDHLEEELGDLLFSIICMANKEGISLDKAYKRKIDKLYNRDNYRYKRK